MKFDGFDRAALDAAGRDLLRRGLIEPAHALLGEIVAQLDEPLTTSARASVSPLHADLRFARAGAPRYKDHLLMTAWHGTDKKTGPTLWIRIDPDSVGFASGVAFTPAGREKWQAGVAGAAGGRLAALLDALRARHSRHEFEVAGDEVQRVPAPWTQEHPRADLLRKTGFQVRFRMPLPREITKAAFVGRCAALWSELLPIHRWLVRHLYEDDR